MRETILLSVGILVVTIAAWLGLHAFKDLALIRGLKSNPSAGVSHSNISGTYTDGDYGATLPPDGLATATKKRADALSESENMQHDKDTSSTGDESDTENESDEQPKTENTDDSEVEEGDLTEDHDNPEQSDGVLAALADGNEPSGIQPPENSGGRAGGRKGDRETNNPPKLTGLNTVRQEIQQKTDAVIIEQATSAGSDNDHQIPVRLLVDKSCENSPSGVYQTAAGFLSGKAAMTSESIRSLGELIKIYRSCAKSLVVMSHDVRPDAEVSSSVFIRREDEVKYFLIHMGVDRDDIELLERS